jgi:CheY-like chemotaxis protein
MSKRILIADDSVTIQRAFAMTFAAEDVTLLAARSLDEGLSLARQSRPDLIIADVSMPGGRTGYELCQAVKSDPGLARVPVYLIGSSHTPVNPVRARECGADGEFGKPFDTTTMINLVWEALARVPAPLPLAPPLVDGVPEPTADLASATLEVSPAVADDYGEIAIEPSGPNDAFETTAVEDTPPPEEDVATPPPVVQPALAPSVRSSAPAAAATFSPAPLFPPVPPPAAAASPVAPAHPPAHVPPGGGPAQMRPSLIPGLRPGIVPSPSPSSPSSSARGGAAAPSPGPGATPFGGGGHPLRGSTPPVPLVTPASARTLVGMPAVSSQAPARPAPQQPASARPGAGTAAAAPGFGTLAGSAPAQAARSPAPAPASSSAPLGPPSLFPSAAASHSVAAALAANAVGSRVDQKMAALAARGPEYEAIAKLSREIIEKVVWEVVPQLAEAIVREELSKRGRI